MHTVTTCRYNSAILSFHLMIEVKKNINIAQALVGPTECPKNMEIQ